LTGNPPLFAVVAALVAPDALAPDALVDLAKAGVMALAPVGFFVLGVQLAVETRGGAPRFPLAALGRYGRAPGLGAGPCETSSWFTRRCGRCRLASVPSRGVCGP
jgi:hypothetical protein